MVFNARIRSVFIVLVGLVCLVLNYCWQYQHCCEMMNSVAMMRHANEGFRPPVFFTVDRNRTRHHHLLVHLPLLKHRHELSSKKGSTHNAEGKLQHGKGKNLDKGSVGKDLHKDDTKMHQTVRKNGDDPKSSKIGNPASKVSKITNVLIVSQGRSGSSFVGQIFNHLPEVFFLYEPLRTIESVRNIDTFIGNNTEHYYELSTRLLTEIFSCNFSKSPYLEYMSRPGHFRLSSRVLTSPPFCTKDAINSTSKEIIAKNKCTRIQADVLSQICNNYTYKVAKVLEHRLPNRTVQQIQGFLEKTEGEGKILYLVRDPRALISSMYQTGWISHFVDKILMPYEVNDRKFHWYVHRICSQMEENLKYVYSQPQWPLGNIMLLRYEDLVMRTGETTRKLFAFVGMRKTYALNKWLYNQMHSTNSTEGGIEGMYSIERNATSTMVRWRTQQSSIELVSVVEQYCTSIMDTMGYVLTHGSISVLQDLKTSLVKDIQ